MISMEKKENYCLAPLTHENRLVLNHHFEFTRPIACGREGASIGLGDRLGIATPGHVKAVNNRKVLPVFAQQSKRELNLTGRTFKGVLDDAVFGVFRSGYRKGFGADADHLKTAEDIQEAIDLGYSMITLDCSDFIDTGVEKMSEKEVKKAMKKLPSETAAHYLSRYGDKTFTAGNVKISFPMEKLQRIILTYYRAIQFILKIYRQYIELAPREIDFEISIDETETPTSPADHYLIARELEGAVVRATSVAPRFCGEFQKGIDYRGDIKQFENELADHAEIADTFGYRLSIHSGSDKFSVFPLVGKYTNKRFHLKTAGTNWLEALRVIAENDPDLYRQIHRFSHEHFSEATRYYHVSTNLKAIAPLEKVSDAELSCYLDEDDARQMLHITYGLILQAEDKGKNKFLKEAIYKSLREHSGAYRDALHKHIGRHLRDLGILDV